MTSGSTTASAEWLARAERVMPGTQSNLRGAVDTPFVFERGDGIRLRDVDGREYLDFTLGMGPTIWGYSDAAYKDAIRAQLDSLFAVASARAHTAPEIELAEAMQAHVPCAEWVRFALSGTEANQLAIRIARAHTGRPCFVRFHGHYHGWMDNVWGAGSDESVAGSPIDAGPLVAPADSEGRWPYAGRESFCIRWNDATALERLLERHAERIGLVLMEPIMCNDACCPPRPGYLERVRELCTRRSVLLAFDEVITGFRVALGGAQSLFGVTPDLAIFGKALAGGLPLAAVAGRRDVLNLLRANRVVGAGTFNAFPLAMAAGLQTLRRLAADGGAHFRRIDAIQPQLMEGMRQILRQAGVPALVQGPRGIFSLRIVDRDVAWDPGDLDGADHATLRRIGALLREEGVVMAGGARFNLSSAMTDADVATFLQRFGRAVARLH